MEIQGWGRIVAAKKGKGNEALVVIEVFNKEIEAPFSKLYDFMDELKDA